MKRTYEYYLENHMSQYDQMLFLAGPRQVGKTTISKSIANLTEQFIYLNWDIASDRQSILNDQVAVDSGFDQLVLGRTKPIIVFDELHKYPQWKNFLKGFFDVYKGKVHIIVTGSAKLNIYRKGNDSLMGRYFLCRVHPISVREIIAPGMYSTPIQAPLQISDELYMQLYEYSGFPEPYLQHQTQFINQWLKIRNDQLFREDIRDLSNVQELASLEVLAEIIKQNASKQLNQDKLATRIQVAATTVKRWIDVLSNFYYCFKLRPWTKNIVRSLVKEPKLYLWDWSMVSDPGSRFENFIAAHLLKAVHFWTDMGLGLFDLHYLRDLDKREVDFLVTKDGEPWILVETKVSMQALSPALAYYQKMTKAPYAFQVVHDMPYINSDCFAHNQPIVVPAKTFLSQLV